MVVKFRYRAQRVRAGGVRDALPTGRTGTVLLTPDGTFDDRQVRFKWAENQIQDLVQTDFNRVDVAWSGEEGDQDGYVEPILDDDGNPDIEVFEVRALLDDHAMLRILGQDPSHVPTHPASLRMYGYKEDHEPHHRSFRYMIEGCDLTTLQKFVPINWVTDHENCDRMCAYHMLQNNNNQKGSIKLFRPENVNQWMNANGRAVGGLHDGLTSDDIQAHAIHFKYPHCAMDLNRSVLNLYIPTDRHKHHKTACYVVVGDHCQPIIDAAVVQSIMQSASKRMGVQRLIQHNQAMRSSNNNHDNNNTAISPRTAEAQGLVQNQDRRKRRRSLDRILKPEFDKSEARILADQWSSNNENGDNHRTEWNADLEVDDWEDDFVEVGSDTNLPDYSRRRKINLPLVGDSNRFHFFTVAENLNLIEERCKPTYQEGEDPSLIHYYICTDEDNVEFIYNYLIRVLKIDPLRYARSYNGRCTCIRMQNVWWYANRDIHDIMTLHAHLHPQEPFHICGLATYMVQMLQKELLQITKKAGALWECMSHYSPNLQRLLDTAHPANQVKVIQHTYQAPYSNPKDSRDHKSVTTLIPMSQRRRVDLVRSYTATIHNLKDDQYPIHDPTNQVVPYDESLHGHLPIGHYQVDIPQQASDNAEWKLLPCLRPGRTRMMSHRMLRALIDRNLLTKADIRLVCATDPHRQNKYGMALTEALRTMIEKLYHTPELQKVNLKKLVNHFVGWCNGTSRPHSGMRYVFQDLNHLYTLLVTSVTEDQIRRIKVSHVVGHDNIWHKSFDYYEIDSSGTAYKAMHLQPVFNMVLEDQALRVFDIARTIPLGNLIQIKVDAIEYKAEPSDRYAQWFRQLEKDTLAREEYADLTPCRLMDEGYLGRYKAEQPKDESKAMVYHYNYEQKSIESEVTHFINGSVWDHLKHVPSWKDALLQEEQPIPGETDEFMKSQFTHWFLDEEDNKTGLLLTGPAGTGKTHWIRQLQLYAHTLNLKVVKTAYTHAACVQMGCDAVTLCSLFGVDEKTTDTRTLLACSVRFGTILRSLDIDLLIIDEISMIPFSMLEVLLLFHRVSTKTRFCLVGDFHQLSPVEPHWDRPEDFNYFDKTDIFPYLVYDTVRNQPGRWIRLTECMRTKDPLLMALCQDPLSAAKIKLDNFPMPAGGIPIWRFICWRNSTRKACNYYCMVRYLQTHPDHPAHRFDLVELFAAQKYADAQRKPKVSQPPPSSSDNNNPDAPPPQQPPRRSMIDFREQFHNLKYKPNHWTYLQNFTYAVGMEVVCRNTLRPWLYGEEAKTKRDAPIECVNNRRAVLVGLDTIKQMVTLRWVDVIRKREELIQREQQQTSDREENETIVVPTEDAQDVSLSFHDFAFNFVPGFCITAHMAQGETIREHYGILEWSDMSTMPRMAYVAVTRGSTSEFLHLVPWYSDPWNYSDTALLEDNILRKLYHNFRWDKNQTYELQVDHIIDMVHKQRVENNDKNVCTACHIPLVMTRYTYKAQDQFMLTTVSSRFVSDRTSSLSPANCTLVCMACFNKAVAVNQGPKPVPAAI